jgi:adenine-specific DNA-methyltransferase
MMEHRLLLAKNLLRKDGVLIVTIDDWEYPRLVLLLEEIFGGKEVVTVVIEHNPKGSPTKHFTYSHEYAIFVIPNERDVIGNDPAEREDTRNLRRAGRASSREERPTMFYPIYIKNGKITKIGDPPEPKFHPKRRNILERAEKSVCGLLMTRERSAGGTLVLTRSVSILIE